MVQRVKRGVLPYSPEQRYAAAHRAPFPHDHPARPMIRPLRAAEDAAAVAAIYAPFVQDTTISFETSPPGEEEMRERLLHLPFPGYAYEEAGIVLGYCYAHPWKERPAYSRTLETTLYLAPAAQGRGIGRALMAALIPACRAHGAHVLIACITAENEHSCRFHASLGFHRASLFHAVGYKFGRWLDVVDYELVLE